MAYYSGSANDMAAVRNALINACVIEGWAWNDSNEVLSRDSMFLRLQVASGFLTLLGRTSISGGDAPSVVRIGNIGTEPITFPLVYDLFVFSNEVYLVVNYSVSRFQWCAFGLSTVLGLPGSKMWLGATLEANNPSGSEPISIDSDSGWSRNNSVTPALFWATQISSSRNRNYWVHSDIDGQGWWPAQTLDGSRIGIGHISELIRLLPNSWNAEAVLLPLRCYKVRLSSKISLIVDCEAARITRIDNYEPRQIINIGNEKWMVFPWYKKNTTTRDGGTNIAHSGTFGWAIRYEVL